MDGFGQTADIHASERSLSDWPTAYVRGCAAIVRNAARCFQAAPTEANAVELERTTANLGAAVEDWRSASRSR